MAGLLCAGGGDEAPRLIGLSGSESVAGLTGFCVCVCV